MFVLPELFSRSSCMKKLFTIFLVTFVTMGVCELCLRFMWHNPYRNESPDMLLKISMNHPNTDYFFSRAILDSGHSRVRLRTDPRSYILPSSQYSDPDATVAFLGGSTTECSYVQEDLRFPALVSQLLAKQSLKVNTLNGAKSGNTLHDSLIILLNRLARDRPDIVVVMHATNDTGVLVRDGDYRSREGSPVSIKDLLKWSLQMTSSNLYWAALVRHAATSSVSCY